MIMISKILATLEKSHGQSQAYYNLYAQLIKCEIYYNIEEYILDCLINLNAILPMVTESNSLLLLVKFYKIYVKTVLKVSLKA